ncbi:hypothetical protein [Microbacterium testaceum]|uniref:hypothetical protein n=1 Tax=Microbacterium testaceum TaxID=2033 RepID=UPI0022E7C442|nr:hypothetical protein [Microbacterium testaceum]
MPATLISGTTTLNPLALSEYTSDQNTGGAILHTILGRPDPDVTLRPLGLRTGVMTLDFTTEALSNAARIALARAGGWTLTHTERTSVNMRFIARGVSRPIERDGRWKVTVRYEEIL